MKKNLVAIAIISVGLLVSCSGPVSGPSDAARKNLAIVKKVRDAIGSNQLNQLDSFVSADVIDHDGDRGYTKGLDSVKLQLQQWHSVASEKLEMLKELADDEYVMTWQQSRGKYLSTGQGHIAGDTFSVQTVGITKITNGKVTEHWMMMPPTDVMKMMAATSAPSVQLVPQLQLDSLKMMKSR